MKKSQSPPDHMSYCGQLVYRHDYDRFLLSLFLPASCREDVWAVLAYNHEIAKTREVVSDATLGLIRLQWWRDAVKAIYEGGAVPDHEVVKPLEAAIKRHNIPRALLDNLAYAREFDLEDVRPASIEGLFKYAEFTTLPLCEVITIVCGGAWDEDAARDVAVHFTVMGLLRATHHLARQNRFYLPEDVMIRHGLDLAMVFEAAGAAGLKAVVAELCAALPAVPRCRDNKYLRGMRVLGKIYLGHVKALDYNAMHPAMTDDPAFKVARLYWGVTFG